VQDVLAVSNLGTIAVSGTTVSDAGTPIGTTTGSGTSGNDLVVTLNASATPARVQNLIRALQYANSNATNPDLAPRTVRVTVDDGDGAPASGNDVSVRVQPTPVPAGTQTVVDFSGLNLTSPGPATFDHQGYHFVLTGGNSRYTQLWTQTAPLAPAVRALDTAPATTLTWTVTRTDAADFTLHSLIAGNFDDNTALTIQAHNNGTIVQTRTLAAGATQRVVFSGNPVVDEIRISGQTDPTFAAMAFIDEITVVLPPSPPNNRHQCRLEHLHRERCAGADRPRRHCHRSEQPVERRLDQGTDHGRGRCGRPPHVLRRQRDHRRHRRARERRERRYAERDQCEWWHGADRHFQCDCVECRRAGRGASVPLRQRVGGSRRRGAYRDLHREDGSLTDSATRSVLVTAVNDAPVLTLPAGGVVVEDVATPLPVISVGDTDAGNAALLLTFGAPAGTFAATSCAGVTVSGSGSASRQLSGTATALSAFLAASTVTYTTASNADGTVTVDVTADDQGNSGTGGAKTTTGSFDLTLDARPDADLSVSVDNGGTLVPGGQQHAVSRHRHQSRAGCRHGCRSRHGHERQPVRARLGLQRHGDELRRGERQWTIGDEHQSAGRQHAGFPRRCAGRTAARGAGRLQREPHAAGRAAGSYARR